MVSESIIVDILMLFCSMAGLACLYEGFQPRTKKERAFYFALAVVMGIAVLGYMGK